MTPEEITALAKAIVEEIASNEEFLRKLGQAFANMPMPTGVLIDSRPIHINGL